MAEPGGVQSIPTPGGGIVRAGTVETQPQGHLPLLYEGTPLHVRSTVLNRLGAALRSNALGDIFDTPGGPTRVDESFDPVAAANATGFAEDRWWLSRARNQQEFDIMVNHAQLRRRDRAIAMENPVTHFIFQAVLDPTNVITAGNAWTRAGATVAQRFFRGAAANAITMGSAELLRDAVDPSTTLSESMTSIVGAGLFGGLIGTITRHTRPSNAGLGRYIDGVRVNAADLANDVSPNHIRGDRLPGEIIPGEGAIARTTLRAPGERPPPAAAAERTALGGEEPPISTGRGKLADDLAAADAAAARTAAPAEPPPAAAAAAAPAEVQRTGFEFRPGGGEKADVKATQAAVDAAQTGKPFETVLFRGTSEERVAAHAPGDPTVKTSTGGIDAAGRATYFGIEPATARTYAGDAPEGSRFGGVVQAVRVALRNPIVVKTVEDMQHLVETLRPLARELAAATAKHGRDVIDIDGVIGRIGLDEVLRAVGHDGLVMNTSAPQQLLRNALQAMRKAGDPESEILDRIAQRMIRSDHAEVAVFDKGAAGVTMGTAGQPVWTPRGPAWMQDILDTLSIGPRITDEFQTIGRIAPTDDWGASRAELGPRRVEAAGAAGAAGTPVHLVGQTGEWQPLPTGVTRLTPGGIKLERLGMTPVMRLLTSPIDAAGEAISRLAEIPFRIKRNLEGKANPANVQGDQRYWQQLLAHANRDFEEALAEHRGVGRAFISAQELAGTTPQGKLSVAEFNDRVWRRLHGQTDDTIPQVNRAAQSFRKLYDELGDEAAAHGFFDPSTVRTPKVWQTTAGTITENYVNRVWNTELIKQNLQAFEDHIRHWLTISGGDPARAREIVDGILTDRPFRAIDDEHVGQAMSSYKRAFDAPSTEFARWLVTDPQELLSHYTRTMGTDVSLVKRTGVGGERGAVNLRPLLDNVREEWLRDIGNRAGFGPAGTQAVSDILTQNLETISKKISAEYKRLNDLAAAFGGTPSLSAIAAIRERGIAMKNAAMDLAKTSLRASDNDWNHMLADMEDLRASRDILRGTYGQWDESMDWIPRVLASARKVAMMTGLTGVVSQLSDVGALVVKEGMTRTFGTAVALLRSDMATLKMVRAEAQDAGTMLDMMLSSKVMAMHDLGPDITGRHTMFERVLNKATEASFYVNLMNPWSSLMKGWASLAIGNRILDDVHKVSGQAMRGMDLQGKVIPGGLVAQHAKIDARLSEIHQILDGRVVSAPMANAAQSAPLYAEAQRLAASKQALGPLSAAERLAARVEQERILLTTPTLFLNGRTAKLGHALEMSRMKGQLDKHIAGHEDAMARLAQAGIDPDMAAHISAQHGQHGSTPDGRVFLPNTQMWSHSDARDAFRRALSFDVENAVISGDKLGRSLWLSKPMGQTIGMFHAYGQATIQKLMIPALQNMDINTLSGVALMVGAGIVSDQLRRMMTNNNQPQSASQALAAGIDRSGVWGWFGNLYNAAKSMHDTRYGPAFAGQPFVPNGAVPHALAFKPDGLIRALGPVASRTRDLVDLTFRTATMDWGNATARDARRLLPLNNVTHLHFAFTELEHMLAGRGDMEAAVRHDTRPRRSRQNNVNDPAAAAAFMRQRELAQQQQSTGTIAGPPQAQQAAPMPSQPRPQRGTTASQMRGAPPPAAAPTAPY